jgi:hypothetical protein
MTIIGKAIRLWPDRKDMMKALESQVAVVTGADRGAGEAIAARLAAMGAHVILVARSAGQLDRVRDRIVQVGGVATAFPCDLTNASAVDELGAVVAEQHKRCDILVNNAGVGLEGKLLHEISPVEWGPDLRYKPARSLPYDSCPRAPDDCRPLRPHHQYLVAGRPESASERSGVRRVEMGLERPHIFGGRRTTSIQYPRQRCSPRLHQYGFQRPLRQGRCFGKGSEKELATGRYCLSRRNPGGATTAVLYQ